MNRIVAAIWSLMLLATVGVVVPLVVGLLTRTLAAARNIERYTAEILKSGVGIANNTANVAALKDTIAAAPQLLAGAESIQRQAATITVALAEASSSDGRVGSTEVES